MNGKTMKIEFQKQTVANLTSGQMKEVNAGQEGACWENIWTIYNCDIVKTE